MSKRQVIAVDIDEVLAKHNERLAAWHNAVYGTKHTAADYFTEYWSKVWAVTPWEADRRAAAFHASRAHRDFVTIEGAAEALGILKKRFELHVITVRRRCTVQDTYEWMEAQFPDTFNDIHFLHNWETGHGRTKAQQCNDIGARYLIDDSVMHCTQAAKSGVTALLFGDYSWNKSDYIPPRVKRVKNWGEVMNYFA